MPKKEEVDINAAFRVLGEKLRAQSTRSNIHNYVPHAKQYTFHSSIARTKLYIGGNRSGKTVGGIIEDILWLTGKHPFRKTPPPPVRGRVISVDFIEGIEKIIKPELARWLPTSELKGGSWEVAYNKSERQLTLANGSTLDFMSYEQDVEKFAGTSMHFIHFDEEPPQEIYNENKARLIDTGGSCWITMTPLLGMTWVYDDIYEKGLQDPASGIEVIIVDMTENPYLPEGAIQEYISSLDADEVQSRIHGKFVSLGGLIYPHFDMKPGGMHVLNEYPEIPRDWIWFASLDHGFNNPTAWLWHAVSPDGRLLTFHEHYKSGDVISEHATKVHEINKQLGRAPDYYIGDPSIRNTDPITGTSIYQEYVKYGIPIALGVNDVRAGINRVASYMRPGSDGLANWHVTQNCTNTIREHSRYRWKTYASRSLINKNNALEEPHKKDDHTCDSLRYFIMSRPDLAAEYQDRSKPTEQDNRGFGSHSVSEDGTAYHRDFVDSESISEYVDFKEYDEVMGGEY